MKTLLIIYQWISKHQKINIHKIEESIELIIKDAPDYEFKTTIIPSMLDKNDIINIAHWLNRSKRYFLQQFITDAPMISSELEAIKPFSKKYLGEILDEIKPFFKKCSLRGA